MSEPGTRTKYTYDSIGNTTNSSGSLANLFRYTGREFDTETNLQFSRARYYDPKVGKFISPDPTGLAGGANPYAYVDNDPTVFTDPGVCKKRANNWAIPFRLLHGGLLTLVLGRFHPGNSVCLTAPGEEETRKPEKGWVAGSAMSTPASGRGQANDRLRKRHDSWLNMGVQIPAATEQPKGRGGPYPMAIPLSFASRKRRETESRRSRNSIPLGRCPFLAILIGTTSAYADSGWVLRLMHHEDNGQNDA